jgi:signal transduction histidine kinase
MMVLIVLGCCLIGDVRASETDTVFRRSEMNRFQNANNIEKAKLGFSIIESYIHQDNYVEAQDWINKLFELNETYHTPDFDYLVNSYQCEIFYYGSLHFLALSYANQGLQVAIENKDSFSIADAYGFMSYIYEEMDSLEIAKKHSLLAYNFYPRLQKQHANKYITQGQIVNQLSQLLVKLNSYDSALVYNTKAYTLARSEKSERAQIMCLATMGNIFYGKKQMDSASHYFMEAYKMSVNTKRADLQLHVLGRLALLSKSAVTLNEITNRGFALMQSTEINSLYVSLFLKDVRTVFKTYNNSERVRAIESEIQAIESKKQLTNFKVSETLSKKFIEKQQQLLAINKIQRGKDKTIFIYNLIGIAGLLGLAIVLLYRNQSRRKRALNKQLLQEKALQDERNLLAGNMHDDLGGILSRMQFVIHDFNLALTIEKHKEAGKKISDLYEESVECMNEMIWCLKPEYNTINDLQIYCREYFQNWCERRGIDVQVELQLLENNLLLTTTYRRNIFVILKEIISQLNNAEFNPSYLFSFQVENSQILIISIMDKHKNVDLKKCLSTSILFKVNKLARKINANILFNNKWELSISMPIAKIIA